MQYSKNNKTRFPHGYEKRVFISTFLTSVLTVQLQDIAYVIQYICILYTYAQYVCTLTSHVERALAGERCVLNFSSYICIYVHCSVCTLYTARPR
jgi:hypothetical protein